MRLLSVGNTSSGLRAPLSSTLPSKYDHAHAHRQRLRTLGRLSVIISPSLTKKTPPLQKKMCLLPSLLHHSAVQGVLCGACERARSAVRACVLACLRAYEGAATPTAWHDTLRCGMADKMRGLGGGYSQARTHKRSAAAPAATDCNKVMNISCITKAWTQLSLQRASGRWVRLV